MVNDTERARFWAKVSQGKRDECWLWTGAKSARGYGVARAAGRSVGAHRLSYAIHNDDLDLSEPCAPDYYVLHGCDNPPCVNPAHLRLGTLLDNSNDATERGRRNWKPPSDRWALSKLTPDAVREIRATAKTFDGVCAMMLKYRSGQGHIESIAKGKTYKWFEPEMLVQAKGN